MNWMIGGPHDLGNHQMIHIYIYVYTYMISNHQTCARSLQPTEYNITYSTQHGTKYVDPIGTKEVDQQLGLASLSGCSTTGHETKSQHIIM